MKKKVLFIEGTNDRSNGTLRQGFHKLLRQELNNVMPTIIMGNGKNQAISKFKKNKLADRNYLLIDLDDLESQKEKHLLDLKLKDQENIVFFMIQEMEAWFISQPSILDKYYNSKISSRLPIKDAKQIEKPADVLQELTKNTQKGKYHKVRHGTALLESLDAKLLKESFEEFNNLLLKISND